MAIRTGTHNFINIYTNEFNKKKLKRLFIELKHHFTLDKFLVVVIFPIKRIRYPICSLLLPLNAV